MSDKTKTYTQVLQELINPETFAFERGSDYGKGTPSKSTEITSKKITDTAVKMTANLPSRLNGGMGPVMNSYLGEDSLSGPRPQKDIHAKDDDGCQDETNCSRLSKLIRKKIRTLAAEINELDSETQLYGIDLFKSLIKK